MTPEPTHSPLPWTTDNLDRIHDANGNFLGYLNCGNVLTDEKNAQLVTAAVVTHKGLHTAVRKYLDKEYGEENPNTITELLAAAREVIDNNTNPHLPPLHRLRCAISAINNKKAMP